MSSIKLIKLYCIPKGILHFFCEKFYHLINFKIFQTNMDVFSKLDYLNNKKEENNENTKL